MKEMSQNEQEVYSVKIIDGYSDKDISLDEVTVKYSQDLDCCQSEDEYPTEGYQFLTCETADGGGGKFIRITTGKAGWSFSDIDEFVMILNDFKERYKCE